jgi:ketosteroid isomerase-like protein
MASGAFAFVAAALGMMSICMEAAAGTVDDVRSRFETFIAAQNAHDLAGVSGHLVQSPDFVWVRGPMIVFGTEEAEKRFAGLYKGTWKIAPSTGELKIVEIAPSVTELVVPATFTTGKPGEEAKDSRFIITQTWVMKPDGWRIAALVVVPAPLPPS